MVYHHTPTERGEPCPWAATLLAEEQHDDVHWRACYAWEPCTKRCRRHQAMLNDRRREARRRDTNPRTFPFVNLRAGRAAHCQWCGEAIATTNASRRGWHDGREGEPDCLWAYYLHTRPDSQKAFLLQRDGIGCADCGAAEGGWITVFTVGNYTWRTPAHERRYPPDIWVGSCTVIAWSTDLQLEHSTPLWKVAHLPDDERAAYFGPENLKLRCDRCHAAKTRAEAAERAAARRSGATP